MHIAMLAFVLRAYKTSPLPLVVMFDLFNDLDQCSGLCQYSGSDRVVHVVSMYCNNNNFVWAGVL